MPLHGAGGLHMQAGQPGSYEGGGAASGDYIGSDDVASGGFAGGGELYRETRNRGGVYAGGDYMERLRGGCRVVEEGSEWDEEEEEEGEGGMMRPVVEGCGEGHIQPDAASENESVQGELRRR
ncbi:unnamed protein product [Closterium sp. NIES-54]